MSRDMRDISPETYVVRPDTVSPIQEKTWNSRSFLLAETGLAFRTVGVTRRRKLLLAVAVGGGYSLIAIGAALGADLALKSAGWSPIPRAAIMLAILLGARRIFVRLILVLLQRRLASRT